MANITEVQDYLIVQPTTPTNPSWRLAQKINSTQTTITVNFEPQENGATITKSFLLGVESNGYVETMLCTNVSGTTLTVVRGIALAGLDFAGDAATYGTNHAAGQKVFTNISAPLLNMVLQALRGQIGSTIQHAALQTFIGEATQNERTFADATARDTALTSPVNGDKCLTLDTGLQFYNSGWQTLGVATPVTASNGVQKVGNDIQLDLATDPGLELDTNSVRVKTNATEGTINRTSDGISVNEGGDFNFTGTTFQRNGVNIATVNDLSPFSTDFGILARNIVEPSAIQTVNHSLGSVPSVIRVTTSEPNAGIGNTVGYGQWSSAKQACINGTRTSTSFAIELGDGSTGQNGVIENVTNSSFDINWTKVGSGTAQYFLFWSAEV